MLVLTRHEGQALMIGDDIKIVYLGMSRGQARIGIGAPLDVPVHREEVYKRIQAEEEVNGNR